MKEIENQNRQVVASFDRDDLRSFFHLLAGKPDSTIKLLMGPFEVDLAAIEDLNSRVHAKLRTHNLGADTTSAVISFDGGVIREFGSFKEFAEQNWTGSEETDEVTLRWDCLIEIPTFVAPQRHALTVRLGGSPSPRELLNYLFTDEERGLYPNLSIHRAYCRVDFINPVLGKELINLVNEWHAGLRRPIIAPIWLLKLYKKSETIENFIQYTIPIFIGLACLGVFRWLLVDYSPASPVSVALFEEFGIWLVASFGAIFLGFLIGKAIANTASRYLKKLVVGEVSFSLTNGDKNAALKTVAKNNRSVRKFFIATAWAIAINLGAAYVAYRLGISSVTN